MQRVDVGATALVHASGVGDRVDRRNYLVEREWVNLENVGVAVQSIFRRFDVTARNRADPTEVLTENQIGIASLQGIVVKGVEIQSFTQAMAHDLVDLPGGHRGFREGPNDDLSSDLNSRRPIAFNSHADEIVGQAQVANDFSR